MKLYYDQHKISSSFQNFFKKIYSISKPHLKNLSFIITAMISAESVVSSDIARKLKDDFSFVLLESIEHRFRRFFASFSNVAYSFFDAFISYIISKFSVKHSDNKIHISFDHMFVKDKFTVSTSKGNGLLNYPIGLITADEALLASGGNKSWLFTGNPYWTMTPSYFAQDGGHVYFFDGLGLISAVRNVGSDVVGVRPAISLKPTGVLIILMPFDFAHSSQAFELAVVLIMKYYLLIILFFIKISYARCLGLALNSYNIFTIRTRIF